MHSQPYHKAVVVREIVADRPRASATGPLAAAPTRIIQTLHDSFAQIL